MENQRVGFVLWITGISASGKSTLSRALAAELAEKGKSVALVDGDVVRTIFGGDLGHSPEDRLANAYRISKLCYYLSSQNISVVCATMSLYPEIWEWNRANIANYIEVYLKVSTETVIKRDPRGLYQDALAGRVENVVGVNLPLNEPPSPDIVIQNDENGERAIARNVKFLMKMLDSRQ